jgi:hypothetical protein
VVEILRDAEMAARLRYASWPRSRLLQEAVTQSHGAKPLQLCHPLRISQQKVFARFSQHVPAASPARTKWALRPRRIEFQRLFLAERDHRRMRGRSPLSADSEHHKIFVVEERMTTIDPLTQLSDGQLTAHVIALASGERRATVALIASLAEFDARRLYLAAGCSSLFTYCTQVPHLSEHAAYGRIEAARAARRFPVLLDQLAEGGLTLTAVCLLAPHLTGENHEAVLAAARHKTKRDVELQVAMLRPQPLVPTTVRRLTTTRPAIPNLKPSMRPLNEEPAGAVSTPAVAAPPRRAATVAPLTAAQYKLQVTLSSGTYALLRRAQDLIRHAVPNGDVALIVDRALKALVRELEHQKFAATDRPRPTVHAPQPRGRHIPADVRRRVWERDDGRCAFVGSHGRCTERGFLEFHHLQPYADGGPSMVENLELRCRAHNAYEAARWDGTLFAREAGARYSVQGRVVLQPTSSCGSTDGIRCSGSHSSRSKRMTERPRKLKVTSC